MLVILGKLCFDDIIERVPDISEAGNAGFIFIPNKIGGNEMSFRAGKAIRELEEKREVDTIYFLRGRIWQWLLQGRRGELLALT